MDSLKSTRVVAHQTVRPTHAYQSFEADQSNCDRFTPGELPPGPSRQEMLHFFAPRNPGYDETRDLFNNSHDLVTVKEGLDDLRHLNRGPSAFRGGLNGPTGAFSGVMRMFFPEGDTDLERNLDRTAGAGDALMISRRAARILGPAGHALGTAQNFQEMNEAFERKDVGRGAGMMLATTLEGLATATYFAGPVGPLAAGGLSGAATAAEIVTKLLTDDIDEAGRRRGVIA